MSSYYQLVKPIGDSEEIFKRTSKCELNPNKFKNNIGTNFLTLQFSSNRLNNLDKCVQDLNINYLLFANLDFENIIKFAKELGIKIRDIKINKIEEVNIQDEIEDLIIKKDYNNLINFIDENKIIIKELEFLYEFSIIRVYDSGIIWSDTDFSKSIKLTRLIESILNFVD